MTTAAFEIKGFESACELNEMGKTNDLKSRTRADWLAEGI